jgi:phosphohistidine swiveling domain-containing protein
MTIASPPRLLSLRQPSCGDAAVVGAKAARLAQAAVLGFPVPESVVVPCLLSAPVLAAALGRASARGPHAGRLEVMAADPAQAGLAGLTDAVEPLGPALAVRSSSPAEDNPVLAGAFSSLMGVAPAEVTTAVLAVWASAIRTRPEVGEDVGAPAMGVLIQPELAPEFAGSAEVLADGSVSVVATEGPAGPLMAGWAAGTTALVGGTGHVGGTDLVGSTGHVRDAGLGGGAGLGTAEPGGAGSRPDDVVLAAVADLARRVAAALGDDLIEWAWAAGRLWLIQARRVSRPEVASAPARLAARWAGGDPERLLRVTRWPGELAERWLLPWAMAASDPLDLPEAEPAGDPLARLAEFAATSDALIGQVWGDGRGSAATVARSAMAALRQGTEVGPLAVPDRALADRCLTLAAGLAGHLRRREVIGSVAEFWALPADLRAVLDGQVAGPGAGRRAQLAALRWEPARYSAVQACGVRLAGTGVAGGTGCGPCLAADDAASRAESGTGGLPPRPVIVAAYPLPQYAPLLMGAAALVTRYGSEAAHLITVARSLGIPAIVGPTLLDFAGDPVPGYAAVDGSSGTVHLFRPQARRG